ncbi:proline-rich protein HaeIII subfamily 1-like [Marmota flaviventris]|uniref:proline-rich protein HaeIII subfamily 1-like n=1 Tax=Marmota flaviventris TaxID=93162 RepID=UPI003A8A08A4
MGLEVCGVRPAAPRRARAEGQDFPTRWAARAGQGVASPGSNKSNRRKETAGFQNPPPPPSSAAVPRAGGVGDTSDEKPRGRKPKAAGRPDRWTGCGEPAGPDPDPKSVPAAPGGRARSGRPTRLCRLFTPPSPRLPAVASHRNVGVNLEAVRVRQGSRVGSTAAVTFRGPSRVAPGPPPPGRPTPAGGLLAPLPGSA